MTRVDGRRVVVIYKDKLLPQSQTFVRAQAEMLHEYMPVYAGAARVRGGLSLPDGRWTVVNDGGWTGRLRQAAFYRRGWAPKMVRTLGQARPKLLHCHFGPDGIRGMQLARKLNVPFVVTFHGYDATITPGFSPDWRHRLFLEQREILAREGARFIAVSNFIRQKLLSQGFPEEKVVVHYIGIDTELFHADLTVAREPVVLFVGRLVEKKGCEFLIRAMARLRDRHADLHLVVIGDGPLRKDLERLARQHYSKTNFLGAKTAEEIKNWMNRASVFCVPSMTASNGDQEGFGLVFTEAQAMGLPVVSFASAGVPEAVADGVTGFLVPERDEEGLARNIDRLLRDKDVWQRCSAAGIMRVRSQFNLRKQTRALEAIYDSVVGEGSSHVADIDVDRRATSQVAAS
jgi:colanic acid/amylovoran biosynthesis glycosyltransferase